MARHKKMKARKATGFHKMDSAKKRSPDYTDIAYREAVARLRYLLAESYSPQTTPMKIPHVHCNKPEDSGDETDASMAVSDRSRPHHHHHHHRVHPPLSPYRSPYFGAKRSLYTDSIPKTPQQSLQVPKIVEGTINTSAGPKSESQQPPPELMAFIERQEDYIEQLEKESQYCREELSNLLSKVKDVISENEGLHEKEKSGILKSVFDYLTSGGEEEEDEEEDEIEEKHDKKKSPSKKKRLEGPSIVFESRISELEAQLTQTKIELRKSQEEAEMLKKKYVGVEPGSTDVTSSPTIEAYKQQIGTLQREKEDLAENLAKLSSAVSQIRDKEADASQKVKRSFDIVDQAQFEKAQAELEVRRLKDELERQHEKLRDLLQEQGRRVQDERTQAERRYAHQVEQLSCDLSAQWDAAGKLQLELEKQRRTESELRRELQQKAAIIDELKKELQTKIAGLQSEATQCAAERGSLEQELAASRLVTERAEREARQESARLQAEITALRQRLDRADADLLHSRRENLRLSEQIASLERELNLAKMIKDTSSGNEVAGETGSPCKSREKELSSMIMNMEAKHVQTVGELESMIQSQTDLMEKLKDECRTLTQKLEESSARHKEERTALKIERAVLLGKLKEVWDNFKELEQSSIKINECKISSPSGDLDETTAMLRAQREDPSMALCLTSHMNSSPNMRHSLHLTPSPSTSPSVSQRRSSLEHIPSTSKNMHHSPPTSPSLNTTSASNSMPHNPNISLNSNMSSMNNSTQQNNPHTSHNQNTINMNKTMDKTRICPKLITTSMSKITNNSLLTNPNLNISHQLNIHHRQIIPLKQATDPTQSTSEIMNNNPAMNSNQNTCQSQNIDHNKINIKLQNHSTSPNHNLPTSRDPQVLKNITTKTPNPSNPLENSPVQNKYLPPQEDLVPCQDKHQVLTNCLLFPQQMHLDFSDRAVPNSLPDPPAVQHLHPEDSPAQNTNIHKTIHSQQIIRHNPVQSIPSLTQSTLKAMTADSSQSTLQNLKPSLTTNPVWSPVPALTRQVWSLNDKDSVPMCPLRGHPLLSLKPRCAVDQQPPLTLEDLATDSDFHESPSAQQQIFR